MKKDKLEMAIRPDAQAFDEIRIKTVPRLKESGLSGDEWRISAVTEFWRKGKLVHSTSTRDIETAAGFLYYELQRAIDDGKAYFAVDGITCDQEGCNNPAKYVYRIKQGYCVGGGNCGSKRETYTGAHRCFCEKHNFRGDCDLEDRDDNYELIETRNVTTPNIN